MPAHLRPSPPTTIVEEPWELPDKIEESPEDIVVHRQQLWEQIINVFNAHEPAELGKVVWPSEWPSMPAFQMDKVYDKEEVLKASPSLSQNDMLAARARQSSLEVNMPKWATYKSLYKGRGYAMITGSEFLSRVFPVGIQLLHKLGSKLPVEIWTKDEGEYKITAPIVEQMAKDFNMKITCHKFSDYIDIEKFPSDYTQNYLMKVLGMLLSSFEEIILLDADNVPMLLPEQLFESQQYADSGLMLWPDFWANSLSSTLHKLLNIPYNFNRTCESGQVVLDKRRHFESLVLAAYYNWYGESYYKLITLDSMGTGDKDTFIVGAQTLNRPYYFQTRPLELMRAAWPNGTIWGGENPSVFVGAMGQFNPLNQSEVMFMHMHSPKLNFQMSWDVTPDLVFVRSDAENVHFSPSAEDLELKIWESVAWVECDCLATKVVGDPKQVCEVTKQRIEHLRSSTNDTLA